MDLKRIESFVAVAELQSFTEAASRLHIVQPAISRQIQQLEEEVGARLLWRNKRSVRTTAAGAIFLERMRDLLNHAEEAKQEAQRAARGEVGRLSIGYLGSATSPFLPALVQQYRKQYPGVKLSITEMTPTEQIKAFERDVIDVGFTRPVERHLRQNFHELRIYEDRLRLALPEKDKRAKAGVVKLQDLAGEPFVMFERALAPGLMDMAVGACQKAGFSPQIAGEAPLMQTVLVMVASGMGASIVPGCVSHLAIGGVKLVDFTPKAGAVDLRLVWPKLHSRPTVIAFEALVKDRCAEVRRQMAGAE